MTIKKFIIKNVIKIIVFAIVSVVVMTLLQSPVITNEIALGQMENNNEAFMLMETYNKIKPLVEIGYGFAVVIFVGSIFYDVYKFIKLKQKGEN